MPNLSPDHWLLGTTEISRRTPPYTEGNEAVALIDGSEYMGDLNDALQTCDRALYLAGWRFTGQQYLSPTSPQMTVIDSVRSTIQRGARVRAMVYLVAGVGWPGPFRLWHGADNLLFCEALKQAGQEAILDSRMSKNPLSSHHQKVVIVESSIPDKTRAYLGGIDLCFDRWDTGGHSSPTERQRDVIEFYVNQAVALFGAVPAWLASIMPIRTVVNSYLPSMHGWHDVQVRLRGPSVQQIWELFTMRWNDSRPANTQSGLESFRSGNSVNTPPAITSTPGTCWVQVLQTLPCGIYPYASTGEQTIQAAYVRAIDRAEKYIYIEDQYLWPSVLVDRLEAALRRNVQVLILVARDYDLPGLSAVHQMMRHQVVSKLGAAGGTNFKIFHLQQPDGNQIYVHSKTMIVDDAVTFIGSANLNHRSMTNDTEIHVGIVDSSQLTIPMGGQFTTVCKFAHEYRCRLWAEHLNVPAALVIDPILTINTLWATAPIPGGRAYPHVVNVSHLDNAHISEIIASLGRTGIVVSGLDPSTISKWFENVLNPRLIC